MDQRLVDILSQTANAASDPGKAPADVEDFMRVLSTDAEAAIILRNELGLTFRSHPA
jgi:hypothetical protein